MGWKSVHLMIIFIVFVVNFALQSAGELSFCRFSFTSWICWICRNGIYLKYLYLYWTHPFTSRNRKLVTLPFSFTSYSPPSSYVYDFQPLFMHYRYCSDLILNFVFSLTVRHTVFFPCILLACYCHAIEKMENFVVL